MTIVVKLAARVDVAAPSDNKVSGLNSEECSPEKIIFLKWISIVNDSDKKAVSCYNFLSTNIDINLLILVTPFLQNDMPWYHRLQE